MIRKVQIFQNAVLSTKCSTFSMGLHIYSGRGYIFCCNTAQHCLGGLQSLALLDSHFCPLTALGHTTVLHWEVTQENQLVEK